MRVFAFDAAVEMTGMTIDRGRVTCAGLRAPGRAAARRPAPRTRRRGCRPRRAPSARRRSRSSRSGRSCTPSRPVFVIFGNCRRPICLPGAVRSIVQVTGGIGHARAASTARDRRLGRLEQPVDVLVGVRVREVAALQVQRQLEDAVLHQLAAVADEQVDVVREQVVVALDRALEEVRDEDRAEAGDDGRHAEARVELASGPCARARRARKTCSCTGSRSSFSIVASAAADVGGWPLNVPAKNAGRPGVVEKSSISSALPPSAETGQPLPIALPIVVRSGVTPAIDW